MIREDWAFYDQNLQCVAILHEKVEFFFNFNSSSFKNIFPCNTSLGCGFLSFQQYQVY